MLAFEGTGGGVAALNHLGIVHRRDLATLHGGPEIDTGSSGRIRQQANGFAEISGRGVCFMCLVGQGSLRWIFVIAVLPLEPYQRGVPAGPAVCGDHFNGLSLACILQTRWAIWDLAEMLLRYPGQNRRHYGAGWVRCQASVKNR